MNGHAPHFEVEDFADPAAALARVHEIYDLAVDHLRRGLQHYVDGADDVVDQRGAGERVAHVVAREGQGGDAVFEDEAGVADGGQVHRRLLLVAGG